MKSWFVSALAAFSAVSFFPSAKSFSLGGLDSGDDNLFNLVLLQMITNGNDPAAMQSLYPLLLTSIMSKDDDDGDNSAMYYLLLGAGSDENMQSWLPLILNNKKKDTDDKLLMMLFMQRQQVSQGSTSMNSMYPLLLLNANDDKYCDASDSSTSAKCECKSDNSEMLLYIMLLNGNGYGVGGTNNYSNFMYLLFDNDKCDGEDTNGASCECTSGIEGGIDAVTWMMLMQMHPSVEETIEAPPQRAIDVKGLLKQQLFTQLGPEYSWMAQFSDSTSSKSLMKFQMAQQMGIPMDVLSLLDNGGAKNSDERFALIQWLSQGSSLSIETMSLMLGIEDAKQFYVHSMIEDGQVDSMTASMLLASQGNTDRKKMKEMLILAATGQIDANTFATIAKPYVPQLPNGVFPGQDLFFIHLEMLGLNTCALIEPHQRKACAANFGKWVTAEQCEVHPYCCYNPYVNGDNEDVPWCYYNIFFVFHDQYKLRIQEADQFKGPQDCPGLFRYNLDLDPFMYFQAVEQLQYAKNTIGTYEFDVAQQTVLSKLSKLIHYRKDVGFAGITEFHCKAIKGACWDPAAYPPQYNIPQCYEEYQIENQDGSMTLNLYDPELFKPVVPKQFRAAIGECDTNYFHISTLYYERRACTHTIDMIKYGSNFSPLEQPTREDCLFRLGCCWEEDPAVLAKYPFMPKCYKRIANTRLDDRLHQYTQVLKGGSGADRNDPVCGVDVQTFVQAQINDFTINTAITTYAAAAEHLADNWAKAVSGEAGYCLYNKVTASRDPSSCNDVNPDNEDCVFWDIFDVFNRQELVNENYKFDGVPLELQSMVSQFSQDPNMF